MSQWFYNFINQRDKSFPDLLSAIEPFRAKSQSVYEVAYLLLLFVSYKKDLKKEFDKNKLRLQYADYLTEKNRLDKFRHQVYLTLALNYFVRRMDNDAKTKYTITDSHMGEY